MSDRSASSWAILSIAAAVVTIGLKLAAWTLTDSVGLLSDAAESGVNLLAALVALWALRRASRPADATYAFGQTKAEYLASGFEGLMILAAAVAIAVMAAERLKSPRPIENVSFGLGISVLASAVNGAVAFLLLRASKNLRSITLRADAQHLLTDVWTSAGVLVGVLLVNVTGWLVLDPIVALLVAANIVFTAVRLLQETGHGLLDRAIGAAEQAAMAGALDPFRARGIVLHDIRTRRAGPRHFIQMHVLVPGTWTVKQGHDVCEEIERGVSEALPGSTITTHLEPVEDPSSWDDRAPDRHL
ncbi:MAG: cation diffusion facilitator family transporter [Thermoanaerobaculia bacterium]|jgi:cation diffusion facilitator family transporter